MVFLSVPYTQIAFVTSGLPEPFFFTTTGVLFSMTSANQLGVEESQISSDAGVVQI